MLAVGDGGVCVRLVGDGQWQVLSTGTSRGLKSVSFAPTTRTAWVVGDEGTIVYGAQRVLEGAVPYRDFTEVMVQVHELNALLAQLVLKAGRRQQIFDITSVAWPFAHDHLRRSRPITGDCRPGNDVGMCVDRRACLVFHHVGFEQHPSALKDDAELAKPPENGVTEIRGVAANRKQTDSRGCRGRELTGIVWTAAAPRRGCED